MFTIHSPKTKLSGLKICPKGPERTESIVPGSKSTKTARGTYFPPKIEKKRKSVERPKGLTFTHRHDSLNSNEFSFVKLTGCFIVVNVYSFQLEVRVTVIGTRWIDSMFV